MPPKSSALLNRIDMKEHSSSRGFTLIELLLYIGIAGIIVFVSSLFFITLLEARAKSQVIAEVEQSGGQALYEITRAIRGAQSITTPTPGNSAASISLVMPAAQKNPTIFDLNAGVLRIKEGAGSPVLLTSSRVTVSNSIFRNLTPPATPGTIHVEFTLSAINPSGRNEYAYSQTFIGSATLR